MAEHLLSDLHLPTGRSAFREQFIDYLNGWARQAEAVYLLGDIFEVWLGDDIGLSDYAEEVAALRALSDAGVPIYLQRGNRDFLLGEAFCNATGARRLSDPARIRLADRQVLISHGDIWCLDDVGYQRWRRFAHHPAVQGVFRRLPRRWRERIAADLRQRSRQHKQQKSADIMDVHPQAIAQAARESGAEWIIHGHTHRPAEHVIPEVPPVSSGQPPQRIVLADWRPERMEVLETDVRGYRRIALPHSP